LIAACECEHGCPTCVGPVGNTGPMAKSVALRILELLTGTSGVPALAAAAIESGRSQVEDEVPF